MPLSLRKSRVFALPDFSRKMKWGRDFGGPEKRARQNRQEPSDRRRSPRRMVWRYDKTYFLSHRPISINMQRR